jgi:hypothetical protein
MTSQTRKNRGFALIVTLSLMILLTVVAVGLLTLSSIALRQSSGSTAMRVAQANARLALCMALGELQRYGGPDQRITATADMAGNASGEALAVAGEAPQNNLSINNQNKGLSALQPGTRHWTGVWKNRSSDPAVEILTKTPSPELIQWLISGNETLNNTNHITPASTAVVVGAGGSVPDETKAVVLVGENSAGGALPENQNHYVAAPLVPIGRSAGNPEGRYAWWIGDEGVKARIDIRNTKTTNTEYVSLLAQRRGWETVPVMASYPAPGTPGEATLTNVISPSQARLLGTTGESARQLFHAATSDSRGVIVDTVSGGTRVDLSTLLQSPLPNANPFPAIPNYPSLASNSKIIPKPFSTSMRGPTWSALKDFYDLPSRLQNGSLVVSAATSGPANSSYLTNPQVVTGVSTAAIAPIITDFRILMGVRFVVSGSGLKTNPCGKIAIALANPYSVPLKWNQDLELHVKNQTPTGNFPSRIWNLRDGNNNETAFLNKADVPGEPAVFNNAYFRIRADTLEPGEMRAYSHARPTFRDRSNGRITIDLSPFGSSNPGNFSNCIEMDTTEVRNTMPGLDVRESWQTTLIGLELRLAGSSSTAGLLTAIDRFDLDNGYFSPNTRNITFADAQKLRAPIPLMLYSFSLSQPGMDYLGLNLMPSTYAMGQRGSTLRTFMDFNLRATRFYKPIASYNPPPYFMECTNSHSQLPVGSGGDTGPAFTRDLAIPRWGYSSKTGPGKAILYDVPDRLVSLAQLQHADLTGDDISISIANQPANAVGNSYATPFVKRSLTVQPRHDYEIIGSPSRSGTRNARRNYYDLSYLLNTSLWDSYFFSSIAGSGNSRLPVNPTLVFHGDNNPAKLDNPLKPAAALLIDGSFNINSTNKDAWKAFLASGRHFKHKADKSESLDSAFPRSLSQGSGAALPPTGNNDDSYTGFRRLSDAQIDALAGEIVKQVRLRGPFLSLSHFINRAIGDLAPARPTPATDRNPELTRAGALQVAIDESGLNINSAGNRSAFTAVTGPKDAVTLREKENAPRADMDGGDRSDPLTNADPSIPDWAVTSTDNNYGSVASIIADREQMKNTRFHSEQGYRSTGIPGWLTQADVLQVIGSAISARSDTFRIRTCGEAVDPSGKVIARAFCEAIVQRIPDYVDPINAATDRAAQLNPINTVHGRQFKIASFRWLSQNEI